ncbi:VOC family protein [Colwellia sp. TT2012]|uniref:VOC family protein n=1 Tax=Colwellia sp. TT2012 TaxID=1720342 RepID=UPI00070EAD80|nr:VOC family protein [Colwellia sp. TT2012]
MKTISKYGLLLLFPMLLSTTFVAAEPAQPTEQVSKTAQLGSLVWADLYTSDVKASLDFYTKTFAWTVKKFGKDSAKYHILYDGEQPIAGVLGRSAERNKTDNALWIGSIATDDVQANVDRASQNKATILMQAHDFALYGKRAVIADPQGGVIALLDLNENNKAHQKISNKWDWAQLFSVDIQKAATFYQSSFNYSIEKVAPEQSSLYLIQQDEIKASIVKLPAAFEQRDRWVNFIEVANLANTLAAAVKNGAEIIHQPDGDALAIIIDPNGAFLGLTEQESE